MNLADIRAKYPQYKDVDDTRLADALYQKYYKHADRREFDARVGLKPYQNMGEAIGTAVGNLPANIYESKVGLSQLAAEAVTDFVDPTKQYGNTPPLEVTPGAPIEDLLNQPAGITVPQNGVGQLLPEGVRQAVGETAAKQSLAAQLRGMEARKAQTPLDVAPGSPEEIAAGAVASTAEMVLPAAAAVAIRNPAPLVAYFTARSAGTGYNTAKAAGAPNDSARAAAGLYAAAEAVTEAIAGKVFVEGGKTLLRSILKGGAVEGLTEAATEALQAMVDAGVIGEDMTMDEVLNRVKTAGLTGAVAGAPIAAMTHGIRAAGSKEATPQMTVNERVEPTLDPDTPIEDRLALPGPGNLLALPSPEQFTPVEQPRRQPALQPRDTETRTPTVEELDQSARVAVQKTRQAETQALLDTARETITPLGTFTPQDIMVSFGPKGKLHPGTMDSLGYITSEGAEADRRAAERQAQDVLQKVRQHRIKTGRPVEAPISIEDMARAKVPQRQIDAVIAARRPVTSGQILQPVDVRNAAAERNIAYDDGNFAELAFRTTGQRNVDRMSQAQLNALKTTLEAMPSNAERVTVPVAEQSPFTDDQYGKALDAIRNQGRYTAKAIKDATGLNADKDVRAIRDAMVRRGQLVERGKNDYRLYDVLGEERQTTPDQLPPGAFKEHIIKRIPVSKVRVKVDGKSIGTYGSGTEARGKVSELRESKGPKANIVIEPAEEVAYGVLENRYDEQGNLLGQVVVDTHRDETAAQKAADELNAPPDFGARYTSTVVSPGGAPRLDAERPVPPKRFVEPAALAGRSAEILKRLNQQAKDRKLPLLGVRVQVKPKVAAPEGDAVEGMYWRKLMQLTTENLTADMTTDEIVDRLGQVMDHELIHALREAGVLGPETQGWKSIMRYARRAKRDGSNETYHQWAVRSYTGIPGYGPDAIEEEAIAEAFRHWAKNRRSVVGQPATVFRQLVEWFKRLINAVPEDVFRAIETGRMVEEALTPPGSSMPRARATKEMQDAAAGVAEAQAAQNENLVRVRSREYLRARAQAREDRAGRSGPKTVLGTTPTRAFETADVDTAVARDIAERYRSTNGVRDGRLATYLPLDVDYMKRIADAQQRATHNPDADAVAKAYRALVDETKAMWRALGDVEVEAWTGDGQPYASAAAMLEDVAAGRLKLRLSDDMFGPGADNPGHPMNAASGVKTTDGRDLSNNDLFRVVHDIYGHGQSGFRDTPRGQYNAYHEHARLLSPEARRALATETLAQGSWQNYGPHLRRRDGTVPRETDVDYLKPNLKEFAEQKAFVLDDELLGADPGWALASEAADAVSDNPRFSLDLREVFRDIQSRALNGLSREQMRAMNRAFDTRDWTKERLPISSLIATQETVNDDYAEVPERRKHDIIPGYELPLVVRAGERNYVADGHHRVAAAGKNGDTYIDVRFVDVDKLLSPPDVRQTEMRFSLAPPTDSEAFKRWFGDSKVVDAEGKPQVVFHGTGAEFDSMEPSRSGEFGPGVYLADTRGMADFFGGRSLPRGEKPRIIEAYLRMEKPFEVTKQRWIEMTANRTPREVQKRLKAQGYDGIIGIGINGADRQYVAFDPTQIKSVNNRGTFDPNDPRIRYSRFTDDLPGGRLYGNPNRSPGGMLSKPGTPSPAFSWDVPGNQFFGGEMADHQLQMARTGDRGATMIYMAPEDYLVLADQTVSPEQEVFDAALTEGYKASTIPSLVTSGYAGNVRAVDSDGAATVRALAGRTDAIPVVLYPKGGESLGLVTALEGPDGARVPWPHEGRAENFPEVRGPRYSVGSEEFRRWFGDSKVVGPDGAPLVVYHGTRQDFNTFEPNVRKTEQLGFGIHFAEDEGFAARYAEDDMVARKGKSPRVIPAFLSIQNPLKADRLVREGEPDFELARQIAGSKLFTTKDENGVPSVWLQNAIDAGSPARAQAAIQDAGYDGVEYEARIGSLAPGGRGAYVSGRSRSFIAFTPTQIKSAVNNNGQYDAANPDIRYSLNAPMGTRVPTTPPGPMHNIVQQRTEGYVGNFLKNIGRSKAKLLGLPSVFDLRVKLQDKNLSIKELIEQIKEAGGDITDVNDTYMLEQLYHGKVFEEIRDREQRLQVPLLDALKDAYDSPQHVTPEDFENYLYARHAPERNAYLRTRGAKDPNPSGMSDAEATAILDRFAIDGKMPTLQQLAALADRISADTTRTRVEAGLISPEAAAASPYQYYVPLRGLAEEELDPGEDPNVQTRARSGKGFSVGGREDRGVTGRKRKAGDLLGHLFLQNTEAVIRAQKNEVALSFMRLIQDNPAVGFGEVLKQAPTRRVVGVSGMIQEAGDPTYRQHPDIVTAKWKGKEIIARVADPAVARAIKSDYVTTSNMLVNALGRVNRWLAMVNTSLNPEFLISNLARDLQTAGILSQQYDIPKLGRRVIGDAGKAMLGIREVLRTGNASSPWAEAFIELQQAGGTTEFLGIHDLESKVRQIRRSVTRTGLQPTARQIMDYGGKVLDFINDYNKVAENAFRLSAYVNARAAGVSVPKAAYLAKNLTINFNKGGEQKALANSLYLFYNASTQGTFVLLNGLKNKRVQKIVGGIVVASIMTDILNRALSNDDDDNGVTDYDDVPDYVLNTNFVLMDPFGIVPRTKTGGQGYFAFPMPYGFNAFWNLGRNMSASVSGSPVQSPGKAAMNSFMGFIDAFNPLGGAQDILNFISPTIADPVVEILRNKDFADNDIVPDRPTFGLPVPESQKYWSNTGPVPVWAAEQLNRLTGGNEVRKGAVDISPEHLQYAFDYATGATGKFAQRVTKFGTDTVPSMLRGDFEDVEVGDIPFARRIVGSVNSRANTERYYSVSEEVQTVAEELEMYSESGRVEDARRVVREHPTEVQLIGAFEDANKALSGLRKQLRELRATDAVPAPRKREMEEQIKSSMDRLMAQLNKLYFERKRATAAAQ